YLSQVSAGSRTWPSASTTGVETEVVMILSSRQRVVAEALAQPQLVDLARGRHRHLRDEHDVVRQPPAGHARLEKREQRLAVERALRPARDDQQRPLLPSRV